MAILLLAGLILPGATAAEVLGISSDGNGWLEQLGAYRILHVSGSHYEMGFQHGELMGEEVGQAVQAYVYDWAISENGMTLEEMDAIVEQFFPFIPDKYKEELTGVAEATGETLDDLWRYHALPSKYHCSGIAAWGDATRNKENGELIHCRSLDYALDIGYEVQTQDLAVVIVKKPDDGAAWIAPTFSGFIGNVGGMNEYKMSVGEMGSGSSDETYEGLPMIFRLNRVLEETAGIENALAIMEENKTRGFNFIIGDGNEPVAYAVETTANQFYAGTWDNPAEGKWPHWQIPCSVRRGNHFIAPNTAATQRGSYKSIVRPRHDDFFFYLHYLALSLLYEPYAVQGNMDGRMLQDLQATAYRNADRIGQALLGEQVTVLWQSVFCPGSGDFFVAYAEGDVSAMWFPGEWYNFFDLLESTPE